MVVKDPYRFEDGRLGTKTYSDKLYKTVEEESLIEVLDEAGNIVYDQDDNIKFELKKTLKNIYYKIRKVGTNEIYYEAIDILNFDYEELTESEMEAEYGSNK